MCCWTHQDPAYPGPLASETVDDRCRCPAGGELLQCRRRATAEDIRCDVCSGRIPAPEPAQIDRWRRAGEPPVVIEPAKFWKDLNLGLPPETPGPAS